MDKWMDKTLMLQIFQIERVPLVEAIWACLPVRAAAVFALGAFLTTLMLTFYLLK